MIRKLLVIVLLLSIMLGTTGCWNRKELNSLAIAVGLGIDKEGNGYKISAQVVEPSEIASKKGGAGNTPVTLYTINGKSVIEAIRRMTTLSARKLYVAHLRIVVISEELAREGISDILDLLSRDHEVRSDFFILVARDTTAQNMLSYLTHLEKIPSVRLYTALQTSTETWAPTQPITLDKLIEDLVSKGREAVITGVRIRERKKIQNSKENVEYVDPPILLQLTGLGVFKNDKLIGWLDEDASKVYSYLNNNVKSTIGIVDCPKGGRLSLEVIRTKTKLKGSVINGKPRIDVYMRAEENVGEVQCRIDLTNEKTIRQLETTAENSFKELIHKTVEFVKNEYKSDIFGFGEVIHRSDPKYWRKVMNDWNSVFPDVQVVVHSDIKIRRLGTMSNSFIQEMKREE